MTTAASYIDAVADQPAVIAARAKMDEANQVLAAAREAALAAQRLVSQLGSVADAASDVFWEAVAAAQPSDPDEDLIVVTVDDGSNRPSLLGFLSQNKRAACLWDPRDAASAEAKAAEMQSYINRVTNEPTKTLYVAMPVRAARKMFIAKGQAVETDAAIKHAMDYVHAARLIRAFGPAA